MNRNDWTFIAFVLIIVVGCSTFFYFLTRPLTYDYLTIEGRITGIRGGERMTIMWDDNDGSHGLTFRYTSLPLPIGKNVRITYYYVGSHSSFPYIENVEVLG